MFYESIVHFVLIISYILRSIYNIIEFCSDSIRLKSPLFSGGFYMKMQRIRDLREDHDLKQTDIADYLHISQRTYSHYETDSRSMPIEVLKRLAIYYNTSMDYLAELTDEKKPYTRSKETLPK